MFKLSLIVFFLGVFIIPLEYVSASTTKEYFVLTDTLNVRLLPSKQGKITNTLYKRDKVDIYEVKDGWARVSHYYDGEVEGISGEVARWVFIKNLSAIRPAEENLTNKTNSPIFEAIKSSDDFSKYQNIFISKSEYLLNSGKCTLKDLKRDGGWTRSVNLKPKPIYFLYCGESHVNNRIYLNAKTGDIFK